MLPPTWEIALGGQEMQWDLGLLDLNITLVHMTPFHILLYFLSFEWLNVQPLLYLSLDVMSISENGKLTSACIIPLKNG